MIEREKLKELKKAEKSIEKRKHNIEIKNFDSDKIFRIKYQSEEERQIIKKKLSELTEVLEPSCNW